MENKAFDNYNNPPFFIKKGNKAALLIHGFTSTEYLLKDFGDYFADKDITSLGVRLAGHGTSPQDLSKTTYQDWVDSAEQGLKRLIQESNEIYLIGYSLGGNISFYLSQKYKDHVKGIISIGTPIYLKKERLIKSALPFFLQFKPYVKKNGAKKSELLREYYKETGTYEDIPIASLKQLLKFKDISKEYVKSISHPILIIQSSLDPAVHYKSADYIYNNVRTLDEKKEVLMIDEQNHMPITGPSRDKIIEKMIEFIC